MIFVRLKELLDERGMSQRELARRTGRHHDVISRFARQDTEGVTYDLLSHVCAALECDVGDILEYGPDPSEQIPLFESAEAELAGEAAS